MSQNIVQGARRAVNNWWAPMLIGAGLIALGIWVFRNPLGTLAGLAWVFTVMLLVSAISSILFAMTNREVLNGWGWTLAGGVLELLIAIVLLRNPQLAGLALNFLIGFWIMFRGITLTSMSMEMREYGVSGWGWILTGGILASLLAFCILLDIRAGAITIAVWAGMALIMAGIVHLFLGSILRKVKLRVRELKDQLQNQEPAT